MIEVRNLAVSTNALPIYTFQKDGVFALISAFAASNHMTNGCTCAFVFSFEHFGNFTRFCLALGKFTVFSWKMVLHLNFHLKLIILILNTDFIAACSAFQFRENK